MDWPFSSVNGDVVGVRTFFVFSLLNGDCVGVVMKLSLRHAMDNSADVVPLLANLASMLYSAVRTLDAFEKLIIFS